MGLIREIVDEIIPLAKQSDNSFPEKNSSESIPRFGYALLNLIFQIIDCIIIPLITISCVVGIINLGWITWIIFIVSGLMSVFNLVQVCYYFILPSENYINPLKGRILGETAVGYFFAAIFKIKIKTIIK